MGIALFFDLVEDSPGSGTDVDSQGCGNVCNQTLSGMKSLLDLLAHRVCGVGRVGMGDSYAQLSRSGSEASLEVL